MAKKRPRQRGREKRTFWLQASSLPLSLTLPLEAGTTKWGFQRGRASPLVKGGVKSPPAKWFRLMDRRAIYWAEHGVTNLSEWFFL
jgi:hypothetical protein